MLAEGNASAIQKKMLMKMIENVSKVGMVWTFAFRISGLILVCLVLGVVRLIRTIKGDSLWRLRERITETLPTSTDRHLFRECCCDGTNQTALGTKPADAFIPPRRFARNSPSLCMKECWHNAS